MILAITQKVLRVGSLPLKDRDSRLVSEQTKLSILQYRQTNFS